MNRPRIAILAHFPLSYLQSEGSEPKGYHCVWLIVLHHLLRSIPDYDFHWIVPDKGIQTARVVKFSNQTFHLLPKARSTVGLYTAYAYDRWQIRKVLQKLQPDLLHAWGTEDCYGLLSRRGPWQKPPPHLRQSQNIKSTPHPLTTQPNKPKQKIGSASPALHDQINQNKIPTSRPLNCTTSGRCFLPRGVTI